MKKSSNDSAERERLSAIVDGAKKWLVRAEQALDKATKALADAERRLNASRRLRNQPTRMLTAISDRWSRHGSELWRNSGFTRLGIAVIASAVQDLKKPTRAGKESVWTREFVRAFLPVSNPNLKCWCGVAIST